MADDDNWALMDKGVELNGVLYYPLNKPSVQNPCATANDGEDKGNGCICIGGQCTYSLKMLEKLRIPLR